jgi:cysteine desulfurase
MTGTHPGLTGGPIYLDYNGTTPVDPRVAEAMAPYFAVHFGNPSSGHAYGARPRRALADARRQVTDLIGAGPDDIVFTGSGSEANALAIRGAPPRSGGPTHVITQVTEHPAVLETCRALYRSHGIEVTYLPVAADGRVDPGDLAAALMPHTALVSIMTANNETGVIQPISELAKLTHEHGALFHTDAAQAVGKLPIDVDDLGVDLLTVVGHKMYAPKGVGALYLRPGLQLEPIISGGGQERGLRAGTESVAMAVALGHAATLAKHDLATGELDRIAELRDLLQQSLDAKLPGLIELNGHPGERLPGTLNVSISGVHGDELLAATPGIAASTGSACHSGISQPSPVLLAMGHTTDRAHSALRLTLGRWTTREEVEQAANLIAGSARTLLAEAGTLS